MAHRAKGKITKLYLHWTAGRYEQVFDDYHISIGKTGTIYLSCSDFTELKAHTWHRNTGSVGIAMNCCWGAKCYRRSDEEIDNEVIQISSASDLIEISKEAKNQSYSTGRTFSLNSNIDLSGNENVSIPFMDGNFMGNGHTITERMRARMVDWTIEVLSNYCCDEFTYFESINIMLNE